MAGMLRRFCVTLCVPLALALTGCVAEFQTLQPYTPGEGVNQQLGQVKVRNLMVVADTSGQGVISASVITYEDDTLTAVAGTPQKSDGTAGSPLVVTSTGLPLAMPVNTLILLTNAPVRVAVTPPDLVPGMLAEITLSFAKAGEVKALAPVVSSFEPEYAGITVGS